MVATTRKQYFWLGMKKDIVDYISKFIKCQKVKFEHQQPTGLLQPFPVPEWKWEAISMDFVTRFPMNVRQHNPTRYPMTASRSGKEQYILRYHVNMQFNKIPQLVMHCNKRHGGMIS